MKRFLALIVLIAATTAGALADATNDVKNAMLNLSKASAYHLTATAQGHTLEGDFVKPNKMHITAGPMEMILIDKTTYIKMGSTWKQFTVPGLDRMASPFTQAQNFAAKSNGSFTVTDLGMKTVDGASLHAYIVKDSEPSAKPTTVYVDGSGYPVRMEVTGDKSLDVVTFSNFNGPITIDAPV